MKSIPALLLALGILFSAAGCGGGGGGGASTPPTPAVDNSFAPTTINGRVIVLQDPDITNVSTTYTFAATSYSTSSGDSGTYTYNRTDAARSTATMQIASSFTPVILYQLTFTSSAGGTAVNTSTSKTSSFTLR